MDISKLTTKELEALLKQIPKELGRRRRREKSMLLGEIAQIASRRGYSLRDLIATAPGSDKNRKERERKPAAVKYRHPKQAELTWTGRGRKPNWIIEWQDQGKAMDALAV